MQVPKWITSEEECLFCHKFVPVTEVIVEEDEKALTICYTCNNPKCSSIRVLGHPNTLKMKYDSPVFVTQWKEKDKTHKQAEA